MAANFTGRESLQDVLDLAVETFLTEMRRRKGFIDAVEHAEASTLSTHGVRKLRASGPEVPES